MRLGLRLSGQNRNTHAHAMETNREEQRIAEMDYHKMLSDSVLKSLCCPICRSKLDASDDGFKCVSGQCGTAFPQVDGIPVLINDGNSVFSVSDFARRDCTYWTGRSKLELLAKKILPTISCNLKVKANLTQFAEILIKEKSNPRVLILGGSVAGRGLDAILSSEPIDFVESDVSFGPRTSLICDAHDIPFDDETFDGVIIQVTLEHVVDPYRCVEEIHRVLKSDGIVYAETAFMECVHGGRYDFTRFTHLGHRRLFRRFEEISSGAEGGPGMSLAWAYNAFLLSFVRSRLARGVCKVFAKLAAWWLKYVDYYLIDKPGGLDAACEYYFMGRKSDRILSDKEIIKQYRGADIY